MLKVLRFAICLIAALYAGRKISMLNQKIQVKLSSPIHPGRIGFIQPDVQDGGTDIVVVSSEPVLDILLKRNEITYFAINKQYIEYLS